MCVPDRAWLWPGTGGAAQRWPFNTRAAGVKQETGEPLHEEEQPHGILGANVSLVSDIPAGVQRITAL